MNMNIDKYTAKIVVNWRGWKEPLIFEKKFYGGLLPYRYGFDQFLKTIGDFGGLLHNNVFYPLHQIRSIEFKEKTETSKSNK